MNDQKNRTFKDLIEQKKITPLIGVYDVFSAILAAQKFDAVFCSGYGFSASHYGLPDEGFLTWSDLVNFVQRIRTVLPKTQIVVDLDEGFGDPRIASNAVRSLEQVGASAIILEDQRRPKKCGHLSGKDILTYDEYLPRLKAVLAVRKDVFVIARTDAENLAERIERAQTYLRAGADAILVEGLSSIEEVKEVRKAVGSGAKIMVNLIMGGKTEPVSLEALAKLGVNIVNYSTPCLFAAHHAIQNTLELFLKHDGELNQALMDCSVGLEENISVISDAFGRSQK